MLLHACHSQALIVSTCKLRAASRAARASCRRARAGGAGAASAGPRLQDLYPQARDLQVDHREADGQQPGQHADQRRRRHGRYVVGQHRLHLRGGGNAAFAPHCKQRAATHERMRAGCAPGVGNVGSWQGR